MSSTTVKLELNLNLLAAGLKEITLPSAQFCVVQNINSLMLVSQLDTSAIGALKSSNTNPCSSK